MVVALPDRPLPETPKVAWIGKTVFPRGSGLYLDMAAEPNEKFAKGGGPLLNLISYRVYDERPEHIQVRTREGASGWLKKLDVVPLEEAVAFFSKQIETNPNDLNAYNRRGAAWRAKGEYDAALRDATEALRLGPSAALYNNRALIWTAKKEYDKALQDYEQAFRLSPQYPLAFVNRALMWHSRKEYDKAIDDAIRALQGQPQYPGAYRVRGISWHGKKEFDKAIEDLTMALKLDPRSGQLRADRGNAYAAKKEHAKAMVDFDESIKLESNNVAALAATALFLASCPDEKYRDGKRALAIAKSAQRLERNNSQVMQALAAALAEAGQFTQAAQWQEHAMNDSALKNDTTARARLELYRQQKPYRKE
jgi:tetratricopeptide (TPR) repeat protein